MGKLKSLLLILFVVLMLVSSAEIKIKASNYNTSDSVEILSAEFRNDDKKGIKFEAYVDSLKLAQVDSYGIELAYGYTKANKKFVIGGTVNGKNVVNAEVKNTNNGFYYLSIYDIPETAYAQMVSARAYVVIGEEVYYSKNIISKNLASLVKYASIEDEFVNDIKEKTKDLFSKVNVQFDIYGINKFKYEFWLETLYNGIDSSKTNYLCSSEILNKEKDFSGNAIMLRYSAEYDAYRVVSKELLKTVKYDYALMCLEEEVFENINVGQYIKFDAELLEGMDVFNGYVYDELTLAFQGEALEYPTVLPKITKDGIENYGWKSDVDNEIVDFYPGYKDIEEITYSPVWEQAVNVTLDYAGNIKYQSKEAMVKDFISDFNEYSSLNCSLDGNDFYSKVSSDQKIYVFEFFSNLSYSNKWVWILEYINSVRSNNTKNEINQLSQEEELLAEVHNFINSSNEKTNACDYSSDEVANGYLNLDLFKVEELEYLFDTKLPVLKRDGYVFEGWLSSVDNEIHSEFESVFTPGLSITYTAQWAYSGSFEHIMDNVSNNVTKDTLDNLPSEYFGYEVVWETSNANLYTIKDGKGYTNMMYQSHKNQLVTVTATISKNGETYVCSKEVTIYPVVFEEMTNPKAVYFAIGSASNYTNNSERYKTEGTLFSQKFIENMNMVYYAFAYTGNDCSVSLNTTYLDEIMKLRQHGIRVLLVLDGQGNSLKALTMLSDDDAKRKLYASNVMDLVEKYNFDGVDIDWEYPGVSGLDANYYTTQRDQMNLNKLMRDLKNEMFKRQGLYGTPYILSAAIPSTSWGSQRYDFSGEASRKLSGDKTLGGINDYCDYVNMMSYDLNKETNASHLTACFTSKSSGDYKFSCAYGVERFTSLGLDKNKIILGSAAYGKAYRVSGNVNMSSATPALGMSAALTIVDGVIGSYASGTIYYSGIKQLMETGKYKEYTEYNGTKVVGSYLYSNETKIYVTFDSVTSVTAKCQYAKQNGFGIMVWAYGEDSTDTLVDTICDNL